MAFPLLQCYSRRLGAGCGVCILVAASACFSRSPVIVTRQNLHTPRRDTYEFQLFCREPQDKAEKRSGGAATDKKSTSMEHAAGDSAAGGSAAGGSEKSGKSGKRDRGSEGGAGGGAGVPPRPTSAFGSRAAEFEAAAEEVRREMREEALRSMQKGEL